MSARYRAVRAMPELRRLARATSHVAIWDDHDFGPNDADGSFTMNPQVLMELRASRMRPLDAANVSAEDYVRIRDAYRKLPAKDSKRLHEIVAEAGERLGPAVDLQGLGGGPMRDEEDGGPRHGAPAGDVPPRSASAIMCALGTG